LEPVRTAEIALAEARLSRLEAEFGIYGKAMERILAKEQRQLEENLAERQRQAGEAATLEEQFAGRWESTIAQAQKNVSDLNASLLTLSGDVDEQEKRLMAEKEELDSLRELVQRSGTSGHTAERIKQIHQRIPTRARLLELSSQSRFVESLGDLRSRRFEIEDLLLTLSERLGAEAETVLADLDEPAQAIFRPKSVELGDRCRAALREEKALLTDVIRQGAALQRLHQERFELLDELERFIRSKLFRIRDGELLGWPVIKQANGEIGAVLAWAGRCFSSGSLGGMSEVVRSPGTILYGLLLFPLLPVILFLPRLRIRRFVKKRNERTLDLGRRFWDRPVAIGGGLISASLLPVYLFLAGRICGAAEIHPELDPVLERTLVNASILLFIWLLGRSFFAGRGTAQVQLHLHPDASHALYRSLRLALICAAFFLLPWDILRRPPFELEALPRIAYTVFTIVTGIAVFLLLRPSSPFVHLLLARSPRGRLRRMWPALAFVITVLMLVIVGLDVAGFRYGSLQLARSFLLTLLVLFLAPPLYAWLLDFVRGLTRRRQRSASTAAPGEDDRPEEGSAERLVGFVRTLLVVGVVLLLASFWGVDDQAFRTLDEMRLNSVDAEQAVSVADVLVLVVLIVATIWFLRVLPGIFEFLVFSRVNVDSGVRYAILTISQYALFTIGMLMALSAVSLDLSRLGWLLAAMGVGLGFGLQEIVANFVCGIILLLERPIRVGDIVTITDVTGTVRRINIRATTLLNFDRQEVIIPNRKLITGDVTNWTGSDTINRLVIQIGVAYGSDVDLVTRTLEGVIRDQKEVLRDPAPSVLFMKHGDSSLDFDVRVFIPDPSVKMSLLDRMNKAINKAFTEQGIEIPFPQRDLHVRSSAVSLSGGAGTPEA
ncbi:MAG: mechanosensitive ion channel domain-containing protein, partial [Planctomycetota bacterium]